MMGVSCIRPEESGLNKLLSESRLILLECSQVVLRHTGQSYERAAVSTREWTSDVMFGTRLQLIQMVGL